MHSKYDSRATTANARKAFLNTFERKVDPELILDPEERQRRARHARKAYFIELGLRSAEVRRQKRKDEIRRRIETAFNSGPIDKRNPSLNQ
jgi:hypothetical protein